MIKIFNQIEHDLYVRQVTVSVKYFKTGCNTFSSKIFFQYTKVIKKVEKYKIWREIPGEYTAGKGGWG